MFARMFLFCLLLLLSNSHVQITAQERILLTHEELIGTLTPFGGSAISCRKYMPKDAQKILEGVVKRKDLLNEKDRNEVFMHSAAIELLGAIGDKDTVDNLRSFLIGDSAKAAIINKDIANNSNRLRLNPRTYGRSLGMLLYRKVPGAQELYNEMLTPEFWQLVNYPTAPPGGKLREHAKLDFIVQLMIEATEYAGNADGPKFQEQMSKIITPETQIDNGYGGVFPFANAVKRDVGVNNDSEEWLWKRGDKFELTDKRRTELQSYYDQFASPVMKEYLKDYLAKKVQSNK